MAKRVFLLAIFLKYSIGAPVSVDIPVIDISDLEATTQANISTVNDSPESTLISFVSTPKPIIFEEFSTSNYVMFSANPAVLEYTTQITPPKTYQPIENTLISTTVKPVIFEEVSTDNYVMVSTNPDNQIPSNNYLSTNPVLEYTTQITPPTIKQPIKKTLSALPSTTKPVKFEKAETQNHVTVLNNKIGHIKYPNNPIEESYRTVPIYVPICPTFIPSELQMPLAFFPPTNECDPHPEAFQNTPIPGAVPPGCVPFNHYSSCC